MKGGGVFVQSGVYALCPTPGDPDSIVYKCRGFNPAKAGDDKLPWRERMRKAMFEDIPACWKAGDARYTFHYKQFMGLGLAVASRETETVIGCWKETKRHQQLDAMSRKRKLPKGLNLRRSRAERLGVEVKSVIVPQDFLPGGSSDWARLRFAGLERGKELVVGKMVGVVNSAEERAPSIEGGWRGKARSIICLHGSFEMTARLDADELTRAFDRDPKLANAQGWASEQARYPGLVEYRISACQAILPLGFTRHAARAFDAGAKKLEFDIDVCLWATGKTSSSWSPYEWLIVSWVEDRAFRMRAGRPMMISPRGVLRPT